MRVTCHTTDGPPQSVPPDQVWPAAMDGSCTAATLCQGDHLRHLASPQLVPPSHRRSPTAVTFIDVKLNSRLCQFAFQDFASISSCSYLWHAFLHQHAPITATRSSHERNLLVSYAGTDVYKYSFFPYTVLLWNILPEIRILYILLNLEYNFILIIN